MARAYSIAQTCIDTIAAWYADPSNAVPAADTLPARRVVTIGLPAADCENLSVSIESVVPIDGAANVQANPTDRDEVAFYMRAVVLGIWIFRCAPNLDDQGNLPAVDDENAYAERIANDLERFELALHDALAEGELPGCGGIAFIGAEAVTPSGDIGGAVLRLQVSLE